jgi:hypothetical protein
MEKQHEWDRLDDLLKRKSFQELSRDEQDWVFNYFESEQTYEQFRLAEGALKNRKSSKIIYPNKEIISSLKSALRQRHSEPVIWWNFSVPAYATIILIFGFTAFGWWIGQSKPAVIVDRVVMKSDTVLVASKPDTVFIEKIVIQKPQEAFYSVTESNSVLRSLTPQSNQGVSMKDNEELESLLVSGNGEGVF